MRASKWPMAATALVFLTFSASAVDLRVKGDDLPTQFNIVASAAGFPGVMVLQEFADNSNPSFRYALNSCIGILGFTKKRKINLNGFLLIASGCKEKEDAAPVVSFVAFVGVLCTRESGRDDGPASMLNTMKMVTEQQPEQKLTLDKCKIVMRKSDMLGFTVSVE